MNRLNLTLDEDTWEALGQHAARHGQARAAQARAFIQLGLARDAERERKRRLAADYAAERPEAVLLLADIEAGQLDFLDDDDAL